MFNISFELFKQLFRNIINEKIKTILKKEKSLHNQKNIKEKKVHVNSIKFNSTKSVHLKEIVICIIFSHLMYIVVCSIVNVMIKNIKIKTIFDNEAKIDCNFKRSTDAIQLSVRQNINIIIINIIDERARFFNVCEIVSINTNSIIISISVFVVKRSDYELLLKRLFQRAARMSSININDDHLK